MPSAQCDHVMVGRDRAKNVTRQVGGSQAVLAFHARLKNVYVVIRLAF